MYKTIRKEKSNREQMYDRCDEHTMACIKENCMSVWIDDKLYWVISQGGSEVANAVLYLRMRGRIEKYKNADFLIRFV